MNRQARVTLARILEQDAINAMNLAAASRPSQITPDAAMVYLSDTGPRTTTPMPEKVIGQRIWCEYVYPTGCLVGAAFSSGVTRFYHVQNGSPTALRIGRVLGLA